MITTCLCGNSTFLLGFTEVERQRFYTWNWVCRGMSGKLSFCLEFSLWRLGPESSGRAYLVISYLQSKWPVLVEVFKRLYLAAHLFGALGVIWICFCFRIASKVWFVIVVLSTFLLIAYNDGRACKTLIFLWHQFFYSMKRSVIEKQWSGIFDGLFFFGILPAY